MSNNKIVISEEDCNASAAQRVELHQEKPQVSSEPQSESIHSNRHSSDIITVITIPEDRNDDSVNKKIEKRFQLFTLLNICIGISVIVVIGFLLLLVARQRNDNIAIETKLAQKAPSGVVVVAMDSHTTTLFLSFNESGIGSGVVIAQNKNYQLILTNRHVVTDSSGNIAQNLKVITKNHHSSEAEVVGLPKDSNIDLALLLIKKLPDLSPIWKIGRTNNISQGEKVIAIGHPLEFDFSITNGIISGIRSNYVIQHSAAINPGNSGGPLFNSKGDIIGINTAVIKDSQGIFLAFSADYVLYRQKWTYSKDISDILGKISH